MAKIFTGKVVSTRMQDTVVVQVERAYSHPLYKKTVKRHKKYKSHVSQDMHITEGMKVDIQECRPLSKDKRFQVVKIHA